MISAHNQSDIAQSFLTALLFLSAVLFNGPGQGLHWLATFALILASLTGIASFRWAQHDQRQFSGGWLAWLMLLYSVSLLANSFLSSFGFVSWIYACILGSMPVVFLGYLLRGAENDSTPSWPAIWRALAASALFLALWGIGEFMITSVRAHGPLIDTNAFAALINLFLVPLSFHYLNGTERAASIRHPRIVLGLVAIFGLAQFATLSRGGLLSLIVGLIAALWISRHTPSYRAKSARLLLVLMAGFMTIRALPLGIDEAIFSQDRSTAMLVMDAREAVRSDGSMQHRLLLWQATWKMYLDTNPFVGSGLGTFKVHYPAYRDAAEQSSGGNYTHNDYLQALQEGGVLHLVLLVLLTIISPIWLLLRTLRISREHNNDQDALHAAGLMLGLLTVSAHALVNFIHNILPIIFISALYLARAWELASPQREVRIAAKLLDRLRPNIKKAIVWTILVVPIGGLLLDTIAIKLVAAQDQWIKLVAPTLRAPVINAFIALRPSNPFPREALINNLIQRAASADSQSSRLKLLDAATQETVALSRVMPAGSIWPSLMGEIELARGQDASLTVAQEHLAEAVKRAPHSVKSRFALVKCYRQLGNDKLAYETLRAARTWLFLEANNPLVAELAKEAIPLAEKFLDLEQANYWRVTLAQNTGSKAILLPAAGGGKMR